MGGSSSGRSSRDRSDRRTPESARSRPRTRRARTRSDDDLDVLVEAVAEKKPSTSRGWASRETSRPSRVTRWARVDPKRAAIIGLVVVFLALTLAVPLRTYLAQRSEFNRLQESNAALSAEVADLQKKVTEQNDPAYIEAQARARLQYVKRGEKQVVVIAPNREQQEAADEAERVRAANPWYQNMWDAVSTPPEGK
ncbi:MULTISPECIES: septum formation initiator family protein [Gordonia]|uniref:septum formation initiator family protein n=1 Tax=Gordonia TaxID=2053 RepID=UPI0003463379